jgi:hypothetical protein
MTVLIACFLVGLLFVYRKPGGYMAKEDYQSEIERMATGISENDDIIICGFYRPARGGLRGEVTIFSVGESSGTDATPAREVDKSRPFFSAERSVPQNYFLRQEIYTEMKLFSNDLERYIRGKKHPRTLINNLLPMEITHDEFEDA